jgi:hypothetical protein
MSAVLLPLDARHRLANFLIAGRCERPKQVPPHVWRALQGGEMAAINFRDLAELVDCFGPRVLDTIRWPEQPKKWSRAKDAGAYLRYRAGMTLDPRD